MKIKVFCILFLALCMSIGFSITESMPNVKVSTVQQTQTQAVMAQDNLKILSSISSVKRGETGIITIQGTPLTSYNIKTSYKNRDKTVPVIQWRTTDRTGVATFNWIVSMETIPGTYAALISGKGEMLKTIHIVLP